MAVSQPGTDAQHGPDIESVHRDVAFSVNFRLEGIKSSLAISTALLAFTVTFRPSLRAVEYEWMMLVAWLMLGLSIFGGLGNLHGWDRFFISYRDFDWKYRSEPARAQSIGKAARKKIEAKRCACAVSQWVGLIAGVVLMAFFTWSNLANVISKQ